MHIEQDTSVWPFPDAVGMHVRERTSAPSPRGTGGCECVASANAAGGPATPDESFSGVEDITRVSVSIIAFRAWDEPVCR